MMHMVKCGAWWFVVFSALSGVIRWAQGDSYVTEPIWGTEIYRGVDMILDVMTIYIVGAAWAPYWVRGRD